MDFLLFPFWITSSSTWLSSSKDSSPQTRYGTLQVRCFCVLPSSLPLGLSILFLFSYSFRSVIADRSGFVPSANRTDLLGYQVGCDCNRTYITCPLNCCGNGVCDFKTGVCSCVAPPQGTFQQIYTRNKRKA